MPEDHYEVLEFAPLDYFHRVDPAEIFPERPDAPLELDLGCGDGGFLFAMAREFPDRNFLGVERLLGRVRKVCRKANRAGLNHVRVLRLDSSYAVRWLLPRNAFARVHLLFPDPWPKKKHHKRRLVTAEFAAAVNDLLVSDGEFLFKTDHEDYFEAASEVIRAFDGWVEEPWSGGEFFYPRTDFERQWMEEGKRIQSIRVRRRD